MTPHVVVIGGGFGGLAAAKRLSGEDVRVTLIDRENHHVFQPLLYQVASASLSPNDIAAPIRSVLSSQENARVMMGKVSRVSLTERRVFLSDGEKVDYDYLVIAAGAETNYFGNAQWEAYSYGLKSVRDALNIRERLLLTFEAAEREPDPSVRRDMLTCVVVGGGPTGVEMAGAISELARQTLKRDFRRVDPRQMRVVLVEMADRVLTPFSKELSEKARQQLEELDVKVMLGRKVTNVTHGSIEIDGLLMPASLVVWASGVKSVALAEHLGAELVKGRIKVEQDCSLPGHPEVFAIGDIAYFLPPGEDETLPGVAPVAMQQGRYVGDRIAEDTWATARPPFVYKDKGMMATIGRSRAVVESEQLKLSGYPAWLAWLLIHLLYLVGFRNRFMVLLSWVWLYVTYRRGARLISQPHGSPVAALEGRGGRGDKWAEE